jgi:hypothetical protein
MAWLTPTRRATRWSPLLVSCGLAIATLLAMRVADRPVRADVVVVSLAMVLIGALGGLQDPAREFVHALPVSAARRLTHRLIVIVPASACALLAVRLLVSALFPVTPAAPGWAALSALGAVGVAACAVVTRRLGARAVDAVVAGMLVWLVAAMSAERFDAPFWLAMPWWRWPLPVAFAAVVVTAVATTRGVEA